MESFLQEREEECGESEMITQLASALTICDRRSISSIISPTTSTDDVSIF